MQNRFGLSRDLPAEIKRLVRQRDGFGCIVCGKAIYDYEHIDPEFADAQSHRVEGIVLLCISCHGKKTRGFLSKDTIAAARVNPRCKQQGFSFEEFDIGTSSPEIIAGTLVARNTATLIEINGAKILSILPPPTEGLPFLINAHLTDRTGSTVLKIINNEWQSSTDNWDVETGGGRIVIRRRLGDIILALRSEPPNKLVIERLDMFHQGTTIRCRENKNIEVMTPDGRELRGGEISVDGCEVGIRVATDGLALGCGGGTVFVKHMVIGTKPPRRLSAFGGPSRNSLCTCNSGLRFKHCCGKYRQAQRG